MNDLDETQRLLKVESARLLIDAAEYFRDLYRVLCRAERRIVILGWELSTHVRLISENEAVLGPGELDALLVYLLERTPSLEVKILVWDAFPFFLHQRDSRRVLERAFGHPRLKLCLHRHLPTFASYHQKMVIVDDEVAYVGGIDLAQSRWDTSEHSFVNKTAHGHVPLHDVQLRVTGPAVQALVRIAAEDWLVAAGEELGAIRGPQRRRPALVDASFSSAKILISRTRAMYRFWPEVHEIGAHLLELIRAAQWRLYIECQYLTSRSIVEELCRSLECNSGPEVILVTSCRHLGWLEKRTLGAIRNQALTQLRRADRCRRLGVFFPKTPDSNVGVLVHSKLLIVDDRFLFIGSANLTNRSLFFDSEIGVTIVASACEAARSAIMRFNEQILAEHLGCLSADLRHLNEARERASLLELIHSRQNESRTLKPLGFEEEDWVSRWLVTRKWADPYSPLRGETAVFRLLQRWHAMHLEGA